MAFGSEVDDVIKIILSEQVAYQLLVADIPLNEDMTLVPFYTLQILQVPGVGQLVQIHQKNIVVLFQHVVHKVRTNKPGTAGD